jgi:hypothetical protein
MADTGYSNTPLPAKLGITTGSRLLVAGSPPGWALVGSPVVPHTRAGRDPYDVILVFCPSVATLERRLVPLAGRLTTAGALWVCWPKKASGVATDVGEAEVRRQGLASGLVDVKIAAIDATWSGLKFVRRLRDR